MLHRGRLSLKFFLFFLVPSVLLAGSLFKEPPAFRPRSAVFLSNDEYFNMLRNKINSAQSEIVITMFLFKTYDDPTKRPDIILDELGKAARRGVNVKVILELGPKEKRAELDEDNMKTAMKLIDENVKVYFDPPNVTTHCKIAVIDRKYVFIGSHNFTQSGLLYNNEASVMVISHDMAEEVLKYIDRIVKQY